MPGRSSHWLGRRAIHEAPYARTADRADRTRWRILILVLMLAAVACGGVAWQVVTEMDARTLSASLKRIAPAFGMPMRWRSYAAPILLFLAGLLLGSCSGFWWAHHLRRRSILLIDSRQPDMTLDALLAHVQRHASQARPEALNLIARAARGGALSIWRASASGALNRLPRRLVNAALAGQHEQLAGGGRQNPALGSDLFFVHTEVRALWPAAATIVTAQSSALRRGNTPG